MTRCNNSSQAAGFRYGRVDVRRIYLFNLSAPSSSFYDIRSITTNAVTYNMSPGRHRRAV